MKSYHDISADGGSGIADQVEDQRLRLRNRLENVERVVAVMSGKGGVGKSSLTMNLASALAGFGLSAGILDADINGASIVQMSGAVRGPSRSEGGVLPGRSADGVQIMSIDLFLDEGRPVEWQAQTPRNAFTWRSMVEMSALREMLSDTAWQPMHVLLVDLPPGTDKLPNLLDLVPALAAAVVVGVPSGASAYVVGKSIRLAREKMESRPLVYLENMSAFVCDACGKEHGLFSGPDVRASPEGVERLGSVPFDPFLGGETDNGKPYMTNHPDRPAAAAIRGAARQLCHIIGLYVPSEPQLEPNP